MIIIIIKNTLLLSAIGHAFGQRLDIALRRLISAKAPMPVSGAEGSQAIFYMPDRLSNSLHISAGS